MRNMFIKSRYKFKVAIIASSGPNLLNIKEVSYKIKPENKSIPNQHINKSNILEVIKMRETKSTKSVNVPTYKIFCKYVKSFFVNATNALSEINTVVVVLNASKTNTINN